MLARRPRLHRLATFPLFHVSPSCIVSITTVSNEDKAIASSSQPSDKAPDSIFTAPESPWDHVFSDIEPPVQSRRQRSTDIGSVTPSRRKTRHDLSKNPSESQPLMQRASAVKQQRASLTAREMSVFDEMFDLIFSAVSGKDGKPKMARAASARSPQVTTHAPPSIGRAGDPLNDLFRTLRRHTSRVRWTTAIDEELDRKKETMELFNTDHELLQWVTLELFGEGRQWDEEAKKAIAASSKGSMGERADDVAKTGPSGSTSTSSGPGSPREHAINHSIYPHLIAHAMRIFRTTYSNPSLSLAIFNYAAKVSIPSYVFGCTAPAYNELMEAKWEGWGDLEGVCNALEEMRANGVKTDGRTRIVVERVRREVGEARPVELGQPDDAKINPLARRAWRTLDEAEVMRLLHRMERLALRDSSRKSTKGPHEETWKSSVLLPGEEDGWSFDGWDKTTKPRKNRVKQVLG